ncbi:MAG: GFA family protein, partial [Patescibacteria group bacterium]
RRGSGSFSIICGAPYMVWVGCKKESYRLLKGTPREFSSSEKVTRSFCEKCNAPSTFLYTDSSVGKDYDSIYIPVGAFDDATHLKTQEHIWTSQKLPWIEILDDLPQRK